ncbi:MAG: tripartite tricarboxylate transporter permease [Candidatus Aenigmarchaeota archaeon]|nr:tripartite tricarboxylate transporter permease [Candidatus Aenigmarchaeota archaeon]
MRRTLDPFSVVVFALLGVGAGVVAGLTPGVHPNTLAALFVSAGALLAFVPTEAMLLIVTMTLTNTFVNFIPSVFLGAPEGGAARSLLPGHRYLLEGRGYEAVLLSVVGGVGVAVLAILLFAPLLFLLPHLYAAISPGIPYLLLAVAGFLVWGERGWGRPWGAGIFLLTGVLGMLTFRSAFASPHTLFPLLGGLFGVSSLLLSLQARVHLPPQHTWMPPLERRVVCWGTVKGFASGLVVGLLPGIGPSEAGVLVQEATRSRSLREYLVAAGGISTISALFSLLALYLIGKVRSGTAAAIHQLVGSLVWWDVVLLVGAACFAVGVGVPLTLGLARVFCRAAARVPYALLAGVALILMVGLTIVLTGASGLLVLLTATGLGLLPPLVGVRRTHAMGCLMVPIILFSLAATLFGLG